MAMGPIWRTSRLSSLLGQELFLVFINDIDEGLLTNVLKFAGDMKIF